MGSNPNGASNIFFVASATIISVEWATMILLKRLESCLNLMSGFTLDSSNKLG
jgi:hypothetical protein